MRRTGIFRDLARLVTIAQTAEKQGLSTASALELAEMQRERSRALTRRALILGTGAAALGMAGHRLGWIHRAHAVPPARSAPRIAIIGGGIAGLVCADRLAAAGYSPVVYEANARRVGGRISSSSFFPGQVVEKGGEFIDNLHKTMLAYAQEFGLALEDLNKAPGATRYHFGGQLYSEEEVVDQYRALVPRMRGDWHQVGRPTFYKHTQAEQSLDFTSLAAYLDQRAGDLPLIRKAIDVAYNIEFGLETHDQSCLSLLLFAHLDRRSKWRPFGVFSDERYHVKDGNSRIAEGIATRLPVPVRHGMTLRKLVRNDSGEYELGFGAAVEKADAVVLAIPFSVLRNVELDPSLGFSPDKLRVIRDLGYGSNAKTMIGFRRRAWAERFDCNGDVYSDLPNIQATWETSWTTADGGAVLTDFSGGDRGRRQQRGPDASPWACTQCHGTGPAFFTLDLATVRSQAEDFLWDLDQVMPGIRDEAVRDASGNLQVVRGHWLVQPTSLGSYTCNKPGYFTTQEGLVAEAAGTVKFAGEHTDSFYEWQGYMEGAANSGIRAAEELLDDVKNSRL